jgi:hypothetical protein
LTDRSSFWACCGVPPPKQKNVDKKEKQKLERERIEKEKEMKQMAKANAKAERLQAEKLEKERKEREKQEKKMKKNKQKGSLSDDPGSLPDGFRISSGENAPTATVQAGASIAGSDTRSAVTSNDGTFKQ